MSFSTRAFCFSSTSELSSTSGRYVLGLGLIFFYLIITVPGIEAPFVTTGEPREALVAQSMVIHNDLLQSVRYDDDLATKPPLLHWLMVACAQVFGEMNEISARFPSVFSATIAVLAWTFFLIPRLGLPRALLFFLILATSVEWYRHAAHARVDMLLASLVSLSLLVLFLWTRTAITRYLIAAGFLMALAALTKGPVGVALPLITTLGALIMWKVIDTRKTVLLLITSSLALLPLLAWYAAETFLGNPELMDIVLHENLDRLLGKMSSGKDPHTHGPLYLIAAFFVGLLPWSLFATMTVPLIIKKEIAFEQSEDTIPFLQWCLLSIFFAVLIFLIPSSKRGVYLLPIYPASATLLSVLLYELAQRREILARRAANSTVGLFAFISLVVLLLRLDLVHFRSLLSSETTASKLTFYLDLFRLSLPGSSIFTWALAIALPLLMFGIFVRMRSHPAQPFYAVGIAVSLILTFAKVTFITPAAVKLSPKNFVAQEVGDHHPPEIALRTIRMYAEAFYLRQTDPSLIVHDYQESSKYVLQWEEDEDLLPEPLYIHRSEDIRKPGKHLEFAISK